MPTYGFQNTTTLDDGSAIKKKWAQGLWMHKNPFVIKDTAGLENAANPYYGYTAIPYVSNESSTTYFDVRLAMLDNSEKVQEDNYLVTYYSNKYSYYPIVYWVKWDVILLIWCTRSIGMRRAVLKYNGGTSFTVIASAATIFSHTGTYDYNVWPLIKRDAYGALHIIYGYRASSCKLRYYYFNNDGGDGNEYDSTYWATANFLLGKEWTSSSSPAFGGIASYPDATFLNIVDDTLIIGGVSPQSSNVVKIKITHKSLATAYNSWPSTWTIESSELPTNSVVSGSKWRHYGPADTVVVTASNGSTFGTARYLIFSFVKIYYSTNLYCPFVSKITLDSSGAPTALSYSGNDLGFMYPTASAGTGPLINDGNSIRGMGLSPVYPAGFSQLYTDRASIQDTDGRTLQAVRWSFGASNGNNATISSDPSRVHFDATALSTGNADNSMLMIEAGASGNREIEYLLQDVANWGQFNQQHSEMHVSTPGSYVNPVFPTHPSTEVYFADHGVTATDTKSVTYTIGKQNKSWLWTAREQADITDKFLMVANGHLEYNYTSSPGGGNELLDGEIFWPLDRETTHAAKGACVLSQIDGNPTTSLGFTNNYSDPTEIDFTITGIDSLRTNTASSSTTNHQMPAYIRCIAFIDGNGPSNGDINKSLNPFGNGNGLQDVAGETGMVPLGLSGTSFVGNISWSVASQESMQIFAAFYDGRRLPCMMNALGSTDGWRSGHYYGKFSTSA